MKSQSRLTDLTSANSSPFGLTCGPVYNSISSNVANKTYVNNLPAAFVTSQTAYTGLVGIPYAQPYCQPRSWGGTIITGSSTVIIENYPAAGVNDLTSWSGTVIQGSPNTFIN